jgi:hypothetical protein
VRLGILTLFVALLGGPVGRALPVGTWGGEHVRLEVSERGAELEFDCAHGRIERPIRLDAQGSFDMAGDFTPEHGGPVRRDEVVHAAEARYAGRLDGQTLVLTVTRDEAVIGRFTLAFGKRPRLMKCR